MLGVCAMQNNINVNKPQELRSCSWLSTQPPTSDRPHVTFAGLTGLCLPGGSRSMQPGVLVHPVRMGNAMLRTSRCSVPKGGVSSSLGTKSHCIPPFGLRKGWSNRLPTPANPFAKGLRGQDVFGHFSVCLEAISFLSSITRHQQPLPGGCCVPCPTTTHLPAKPSGHFSSLLQDVKSHQDFPALYP